MYCTLESIVTDDRHRRRHTLNLFDYLKLTDLQKANKKSQLLQKGERDDKLKEKAIL